MGLERIENLMNKISNQVSLDSPIASERILIDTFSDEDITSEYISWLNDKEVVQFSNQRFIKHTKDSCMIFLNGFKDTDSLFVKIVSLNNKKTIGTMTAYINSNHGTCDVGILLGDKGIWGKGYGLEAWILFTNWLKSHAQIRKLTAGTSSINKPMLKILKKSNFSIECTRKQHEIIENKLVDLIYFIK